MEDGFIRFENVKKIYRSGEVEVTALHDVSFSVSKGEICVIVGESGAGEGGGEAAGHGVGKGGFAAGGFVGGTEDGDGRGRGEEGGVDG